MPRIHSGEEIFFTSKTTDSFILDSFGHLLSIDNCTHEVFARTTSIIKRGTRVIFKTYTDFERHLNDIFMKYTNISSDSDYGFDKKTEIQVKLFTSGGVHISRSQARRILEGLEKFKVILLDYKDVPLVGQAFTDEIYRVFQNKHPDIIIQEENMSEGVKFMVKRVKTEATRK